MLFSVAMTGERGGMPLVSSATLAAKRWSMLSPTVSPSPRTQHATAYDAKNDRVVWVGGIDANRAELAETWIFDDATWTRAPSLSTMRVGPASDQNCSPRRRRSTRSASPPLSKPIDAHA